MLAIAGYLPGRALGNAENFHHVFFECDYQPVTYTLGIGYHYMFTNYFGAGASLGFLGDTISNTDVMREYRSNGRGSRSKPVQGFYIDVAFNF